MHFDNLNPYEGLQVIFNPIGTIYNPFETVEGMPIQSKGANGAIGKVTVFPAFAEGLQDLDGFSHIILLYYFHQVKGTSLLVKPFLDTRTRGIFATRAPKRPNAIGISVVELLSIDDCHLAIKNIDVLNETPLLDIKPYISDFDHHSVSRSGWYHDVTASLADVKSDDRFK